MDNLIIKTAYDAPGEVIESGRDDKIAAEMAMAKGILAFLNREYRGYPWKVHVDFRQGVVAIKLNGVMPDTQWFVAKLTDIATAQDFERLVRRAGGEILEKYGQRRSRIYAPDFAGLLAQKPWFDKQRLVQ